MTTVIGFDPGVTGAMAILTDDQAPVLHDLPTVALPRTERSGTSFVPRRLDARAIAMVVREACPRGSRLFMFCERVQATRGIGQSSMQAEGSLMRSLGAIEAVGDILQAPVTLVLPQHWQAFYGLVGKGSDGRARGELPAAARRAIELYPDVRGQLERIKDHNRAEALLVAHYGLRKLLPEW